MNKHRPTQEVLYAIMRVTFTQILIMVVLTSIVSAAPWRSDAQEILDRKVSLNANNTEIKAILSEIEEQTSVVFTYRPRPINSSKKISIKVENEPLGTVLTQLFDDNVAWVVIDDEEEIVLKPKSEKRRNSLFFLLTVSGTVVDENGETLPGVNVLEKGTTNGTTTNANGEFNLEVQNENSILVFSFIGYTSQEIRVGNQTNIHVSMVPDVETLQEVVVVGYGEQKKATLTGSVSNINGGEIVKSPSQNVATSLAGRLPGLIVSQRSGVPGSENLDFSIRGAVTFGDNNPLIIVDGVDRGDVLERLNPQDIESITVLKDASAAIYGARSANGVILVTTKKGSKSKSYF